MFVTESLCLSQKVSVCIKHCFFFLNNSWPGPYLFLCELVSYVIWVILVIMVDIGDSGEIVITEYNIKFSSLKAIIGTRQEIYISIETNSKQLKVHRNFTYLSLKENTFVCIVLLILLFQYWCVQVYSKGMQMGSTDPFRLFQFRCKVEIERLIESNIPTCLANTPMYF